MTNTTALDLESIAQHEAIEAAVDQHYPKQDSPHASVRDRIGAARLAFRKGYRAALAAKGQQEPVAGDRLPHTVVSEALGWLDAALKCKEFHWDGDQRECAQWALDQSRKSLAAPVAQQSEAGAQDAARYRFLREHWVSFSAAPPLSNLHWKGDKLDAKVDAAILEGGAHG